MSTRTIKLRLYPSESQSHIFGQWNYSDQMFRNFAVRYLRDRYTNRKTWIHKNHRNPKYLAWLEQIEIVKAQIKVFNQTYKSEEERKAATKEGLRPVYPAPIDSVFDDDMASLSAQLTLETGRSRKWLVKTLSQLRASGQEDAPQLKRLPKSVSEFVNGLPLSLRKQLQKIARNEGVLFYVLFAPRTVFSQTIIDLKKTYTKAYSNLKAGKSVKDAGFPKFKKITRHGGIRLQLDNRVASFLEAWNNQDIVVTEMGTLPWEDNGYCLPHDPAKMITLKKAPCGQFHATFVGLPTYKAGKEPQVRTENLPAHSVAEFLDQFSEGFDLNRLSGLPLLVGSHVHTGPEDQIGHEISILGKQDLANLQKKIKRKERYIAYQQAVIARQRRAGKQSKKRNKKNPNSAHRPGKVSHRLIKTQAKVNVAHRDLNNTREAYKLALANLAVSVCRVLMIEDLDVKGMKEASRPQTRTAVHHKNDKHSQHVSGFGSFINTLEDVCEKHNIALLKCHQFDPTSQLCHKCGYRWGKVDTSVRTILCEGCNTLHDRDYNSTMNIKFLALYRYTKGENTLNNLELLSKQFPNQVNIAIPLAERVDGNQVITHLAQISHEEIIAYIRERYPLDKVLEACKRKPATCGNGDQGPSGFWLKPKSKSRSRPTQSAQAA